MQREDLHERESRSVMSNSKRNFDQLLESFSSQSARTRSDVSSFNLKPKVMHLLGYFIYAFTKHTKSVNVCVLCKIMLWTEV